MPQISDIGKATTALRALREQGIPFDVIHAVLTGLAALERGDIVAREAQARTPEHAIIRTLTGF